VAEPELRQLCPLLFADGRQRRHFPLEGMSLAMPHECQCAHDQ
jgi:hypothetical protein